MADNKSERSVYNFLSIAMKAGKVKSGEFSCEAAVKDSTAKLVIIATDASDNTKKLFADKSTYRNIPYVIFGTKDNLGHAIGKKERSSVAVIDEGLAKALSDKISNLKNIQEESV
ncbi:MAG: L7Ae/L30e/S12e/Gadd45 family ribosomal protein [Lachnospiraceae bacterium]|nr:L7Ae/L30e/S12e/Gadd45 family ribosomal protein [Lachnospiraceae bacterium]